MVTTKRSFATAILSAVYLNDAEGALSAVMRAAFQLAVNPGRASLFLNLPLLG
jgi:hypothetical protein